MITRRFVKVTGITVITAVAIALSTGMALAEHFKIDLKVTDPQGRTVQAFTDETPPIGGLNPRPVLHIKAGEELKVTWTIQCEYPHGVLKNAGVHFFVVREANLGQKPVPDPSGTGGIIDNEFAMDFKPGATASGFARFRIDAPGNYLVRLQSENTWQVAGHEHFSAIDVQVK